MEGRIRVGVGLQCKLTLCGQSSTGVSSCQQLLFVDALDLQGQGLHHGLHVVPETLDILHALGMALSLRGLGFLFDRVKALRL